MKKLEKTVHFVAEGTSVGCYDSAGSPVKYILVNGEPFIEIAKCPDRLFTIDSAIGHDGECTWLCNYNNDFPHVRIKAVVNGVFVTDRNGRFSFAERSCSKRELASFYLAKYKALKNSIKLTEVVHG